MHVSASVEFAVFKTRHTERKKLIILSTIPKIIPLNVDDYLALEKASEIRHKLVDGYLIAIVGTTQRM